MTVFNCCAKIDCKNVNCTRHSNQYGYICDECFELLCRSYENGVSIKFFLNDGFLHKWPKSLVRHHLEEVYSDRKCDAGKEWMI